jgi:cytochrome oxidase Cu insertion factor (SCO1/SenC/PrrC family)
MRASDGMADILTDVDRLRCLPQQGEAVATLLAEQSPIYAGRSTADAEFLRGYVLASFGTMGLPASAMPFVIEELETGLNSYVVAAAAKALRGSPDAPEGIVPLLLGAIDRLRGSDDVVSFDRSHAPSPGEPPTTALMELFRTLAWLGPRAGTAEAPLQAMLDQRPSSFSVQVRGEIEKALVAVSRGSTPAGAHCCATQPPPLSFAPAAVASPAVDIAAIELQDQDGAVFPFGEFFRGQPSVVTFFYTRCMNPNKCSVAITRLARLQHRIREAGLEGRINVAAISYDPAFDLPRRLHAYGSDRGMCFDHRNRLLRTTGPFEPLQRWLDLGVGYGSSTVNQHRSDLVLLDAAAQPCVNLVRRQWDEDDVFSAIKQRLAPPCCEPG